jgi:DNA-binding transcriptional MocR family regulator
LQIPQAWLTGDESIGHNPTSGTLSIPRRKELYRLCQEYDVIIIEDDPYWHLQFPSVVGPDITRHHFSNPCEEAKKSSGFDFLDSLVPSYLSIDIDGRVVRLDTFSKTISPGCRLGWITAQPALIERILRITEVATQQPSGFVQSIVAEHLIGPHDSHDSGRGGGRDGKGWAVEGWVRWLAGLRGIYERRMQKMCGILEDGKYMLVSKGLSNKGITTEEPWNTIDKVQMYDFVWPRGGMFVWIKIQLPTHPLHGRIEPLKLSHALWVHLTTKPYLVLVAPGTIFSPTPEIAEGKGYMFYRLCFAAPEDDEVEAASHRFVDGVNSFWTKKDLGEVEDMLRVGGRDCMRV